MFWSVKMMSVSLFSNTHDPELVELNGIEGVSNVSIVKGSYQSQFHLNKS